MFNDHIMNIENIKIILENEDEEKDDLNIVGVTNMSQEILYHLDISDENAQNHKNDLFLSHSLHYQMNYTVKQLLLICDYYEMSKARQLHKSNKEQLIQQLVLFENNPENVETVSRRQTLWFYMSELKNDKFMKKYVLW